MACLLALTSKVDRQKLLGLTPSRFLRNSMVSQTGPLVYTSWTGTNDYAERKSSIDCWPSRQLSGVS